MKYLMILIIVLFISCSTVNEVSWTVEDGYVIVQLDEINPNVETYYVEITLESGSRIAVPLGKPDENRKFRIKNNFGNFIDLEIYTNLDL